MMLVAGDLVTPDGAALIQFVLVGAVACLGVAVARRLLARRR